MRVKQSNKVAHTNNRDGQKPFLYYQYRLTKPLFLKLTAQIGLLTTRGVKSKVKKMNWCNECYINDSIQ